MKSSRHNERTQFLIRHGFGDEQLQPLAADASFRRYFRLLNSKPPLLLMDAPPPLENIGPFVDIALHLKSLGFRPPEINAFDKQNGFVLLEDFGEHTFTRLLNDERALVSEKNLYRLGADVLIRLHEHTDSTHVEVPEYDHAALIREASLFSHWYLPSVSGSRPSNAAHTKWRDIWQNALSRLPPAPTSLVLRDFHVDNLMIVDTDLSAEHGTQLTIEQCGLLDFQDAVTGSPAYDLVSLLEDARRDVSEKIRQATMNHYLEHSALTASEYDRRLFKRYYRMLGAQRHAKVAGIFVRLAARDGKHNYLAHVPRVLKLFKNSLSEAEDLDGDFLEIREWIEDHLSLSGRRAGFDADWPLPVDSYIHSPTIFPATENG